MRTRYARYEGISQGMRTLREPGLSFCSSTIRVALAYQQKGSLIEGPLKPLGTMLNGFHEALKCVPMMLREASLVDGCTKRERSAPQPQGTTTEMKKSEKFHKHFKTFPKTLYVF